MSIKITEFGKLNEKTISKITLDNGIISASVIDFGATLCELFVPDKNGVKKDIVCGYDNIENYATESGYLGATVGRYANRINGAKFSLNGKEYVLYKNEKNSNLHGGKIGFSHKIWDFEIKGENAVCFSLFSKDGDEGFPGDLDLKVTYELKDNQLGITYDGDASCDTIINMTNHSYFNMDGYDAGNALSHTLYIPASYYDKVNSDSIPVGKPVSVKNTEFDFTTEREIGIGYDHNFVLDKGQEYGLAAKLKGKSGRICTAYTDLPAIQIYTACFLKGKPMKNNVEKVKFGAVCLETQFSPDTPNRPYMPQCVYGPDKKFHSVTNFVFTAE